MFRLIKVIVIIGIVCLVIGYGYSWAFNKVIPKPDVPAVATAISETVDAIPTNGNSQWSIGQVLEVKVEDFVIEALVVDQSKSWYVVDSADLDLWRCESTDTDTCQPTTVNCEGKVTFNAMKIETELYKECY